MTDRKNSNDLLMSLDKLLNSTYSPTWATFTPSSKQKASGSDFTEADESFINYWLNKAPFNREKEKDTKPSTAVSPDYKYHDSGRGFFLLRVDTGIDATSVVLSVTNKSKLIISYNKQLPKSLGHFDLIIKLLMDFTPCKFDVDLPSPGNLDFSKTETIIEDGFLFVFIPRLSKTETGDYFEIPVKNSIQNNASSKICNSPR